MTNIKIPSNDPRLSLIMGNFEREVAAKRQTRMSYSDYKTVRYFLSHAYCPECEIRPTYFILDDGGSLQCPGCGDTLFPYDYNDFIGDELVKLFKTIVGGMNQLKTTVTNTNTKTITNNNNVKVEGGNNNMFNLDGMFKNLKFGAVNGDTFRISPMGTAFKTAEGYSVYNTDKEELTDVTGMVFDIPNSIFAMPVTQSKVKVNDVIIHAGSPVVVKEVKAKTLVVVYPFASEVKEIIPTKSMFGFNFYTKISALFDLGKADENNPFGNIMPLIMMSGQNGQGGGMNPMAMMMMMGGFGDDEEEKDEDGNVIKSKDKGMDKNMMMALAFSGMGSNGNATNNDGNNNMMMALAMSKMFK